MDFVMPASIPFFLGAGTYTLGALASAGPLYPAPDPHCNAPTGSVGSGGFLGTNLDATIAPELDPNRLNLAAAVLLTLLALTQSRRPASKQLPTGMRRLDQENSTAPLHAKAFLIQSSCS